MSLSVARCTIRELPEKIHYLLYTVVRIGKHTPDNVVLFGVDSLQNRICAMEER